MDIKPIYTNLLDHNCAWSRPMIDNDVLSQHLKKAVLIGVKNP